MENATVMCIACLTTAINGKFLLQYGDLNLCSLLMKIACSSRQNIIALADGRKAKFLIHEKDTGFLAFLFSKMTISLFNFKHSCLYVICLDLMTIFLY